MSNEMWEEKHTVELTCIEIKKTKAGNPAIQLVFKTKPLVVTSKFDVQWIREYIDLKNAPDLIWERLGKWLNISGNIESIKKCMTQAETASKLIGTQLEVLCNGESYQGKNFLSIEDVLPDDSKSNKATQELLSNLYSKYHFDMADVFTFAEHGADINCKTRDGEYLLFYLLKDMDKRGAMITMYGDCCVINTLLALSEEGMDITNTDKDGNSIFVYIPNPTAKEFWPEGNKEFEQRIASEEYLSYVELERIIDGEDFVKTKYPFLYECDEEE